MKKYYAKNYINGMKMAGYQPGDTSQQIFVMDMFCSHFSECEENEEYRAIIHDKGKDFMKFCAAYAQLKTSLKIGCSNDAPYDIKSFLHLSNDEFDYYVEILPPRLAGFAKGAYNLFHKSDLS
ncbi:MAG: hypothetical protein J6Y71_10240 [Ruminococcus sp.]|nr:hypothetical protein [Ruminococcus sp.]